MTPLPVLADLALPANIPILGWAWDDLLFLILAGVMLGCALFVVLGRNIVRSGIAMMGCFAALAGIYVLAGAVIVAASEVLVYIGAISVLILFAIMLTQTKSGPSELVFHHQAWAGALAAIGFCLLLIVSVVNTQWPLAGSDRLVASTSAIAMLLFQDSLYIFALQVVAVLLTAAVIGGVFLAKREVSSDPGEPEMATLDRLRAPVEAATADQPA
ncbi:MAG TPA: NADH-quinone oxidoreductase subunit J [Candidatus Limnocylindrales bacterium]